MSAKQPLRSIKNVLVTGGAGFIGSAFIRYILSKEVNFLGQCINFDALTYSGNLENLKTVQNDSRYIFVKGNVCDKELLSKICKDHAINTIIHFAAESHVDRSILGPKVFVETNILGTFNLLEVVRENPHIHFHHVSTDEVYGSLGEEGLFTEHSPYQPNSPYSASKAASDHLVRAYNHTYNLSTCISNCSNNYGPYHFPEKFIPLVIEHCLNAQPIPIYGTGENVRDWLHVEDHAKALYGLLLFGRKGETYNIGGESEWKNIDLVDEIIDVVADTLQIEVKSLQNLKYFVSDRPGHDYRYAIDCTKIKKETGWKPSKNFRELLKQTVLWYIENKDWVEKIKSGSYQDWCQQNYLNRF